MTPLRYAEASARTDTLTGRDALASYALGLCGESAEACDLRNAPERTAEELGDCFWYLFALARHTVGVGEVLFWIGLGPFPYILEGDTFDRWLLRSACIVAEQVKKRAYHDADNLPALRAALREYTSALLTVAVANDAKLSDVLGANIDKLLARYPVGFVTGEGER